jgi:hypothetical protein
MFHIICEIEVIAKLKASQVGLGNLDAFFGRCSRLFLDYFQVKFRLFLDGLVKNKTLFRFFF